MRPLELGTDQRIFGGARRKLPAHPGLEGTGQGCCSGLLVEVGDTAKTTEHARSDRRAPETRRTQAEKPRKGL